MSPIMIRRWLIVCLLPLLTLAYFNFNPTALTPTNILLRGIILACESAFLLKYLLFAIISHHLKGEYTLKRQTSYLFFPLILLILYICHYFGLF